MMTFVAALLGRIIVNFLLNVDINLMNSQEIYSSIKKLLKED